MWTRHDAIRRGVAPRSSARYAELCSAPEVGALAVARSIPALALVALAKPRRVGWDCAPAERRRHKQLSRAGSGE
jgi:hypothetical protein